MKPTHRLRLVDPTERQLKRLPATATIVYQDDNGTVEYEWPAEG